MFERLNIRKEWAVEHFRGPAAPMNIGNKIALLSKSSDSNDCLRRDGLWSCCGLESTRYNRNKLDVDLVPMLAREEERLKLACSAQERLNRSKNFLNDLDSLLFLLFGRDLPGTS